MSKTIGKSLLAFAALLTVAMPSLAETTTTNGITWTYTVSNGEASLGGETLAVPKSTTGVITIPSTLDGYPVTSIEGGAFTECTRLAGVTIPDGVTRIGDDAFRGCASLASVVIPDSVRSVGDCAFEECNTLLFDTATIPGVKLVDGWVVGYKDWLSGSLDLTGARGIADWAFCGCCDLTSVNVPDGVVAIGYGAFQDCTGLVSVTIPDSVMTIGEGAFENCDALFFDTATIPGVKLVDGWVVGFTDSVPDTLNLAGIRGIGDSAFSGCGVLTSVIIPDGVANIGNCVFYECSGLTSVSIPASVATIGDGAFYGCSGLTGLELPEGVTRIGDSAFSGCCALTSMKTPRGVTFVGNEVFCDCGGLTNVTIGVGVTGIGDLAFSGCSGLSSVIIPDNVTRIGADAFNGCSNLVNVVIGARVTHVGESAFENCHASLFDTTTIPGTKIIDGWVVGFTDSLPGTLSLAGVRGIGDYAFSGSGLVNVNVSDDVTWIGDEAFENCSELMSISVGGGNPNYRSEDGLLLSKDGTCLIKGVNGRVIIPDSVERIEDGAFSYLGGLTDIVIPDRVRSVGESAFSDCSGLTNIVIPDSVRSVGRAAFSGCSGLTNVTIGIGVESIEYRTFRGCSGLTNMVIPDSVTSIGGWAFNNCSGLTSVTIGSGVTSIGKRAFSGCDGLKRVAIGGRVKDIVYSAFEGCSGIREVSISQSVLDRTIQDVFPSSVSSITNVTYTSVITEIGADAFSGCSGLTSVTVPESVKWIDDSAFWGCSNIQNVSISQIVLDHTIQDVFPSCVSSITTVTCSSGVTNIGANAFSGCSGLTRVSIPDSVRSVDSSAFDDCNASIIDAVTIPGVKLVDGWVVGLTGPLSGSLNLSGVRGIGDSAFIDCKDLTSVAFDDGLTSIGELAFYGCSGLTSVAIPDHVTSIGRDAFGGCSGLARVTVSQYACDCGLVSILGNNQAITEIVLSANVTNLVVTSWDSPFRSLSSVEKVSVEAGNQHYKAVGGLLLTKDGKDVVFVPEGRRYVFIPDGVIHLPSHAFNNSTQIDRNTDSSGIESIDGWIVGCNRSRLPSRLVLNGYRGIADGVFRYCDSLTSVTIGEGVESIGADAFGECPKLTSVTIPASVTSIGEGALDCAVNLKTISLAPGNVNYKYSGGLLLSADNAQLVAVSRNATTVNIPNGVSSIPSGFFAGCMKLTNVTISASVKELGDGYGDVFAYWDDDDEDCLGCPALKTIAVSADNPVFKSENGLLLGLDADGDYDGWGLWAVPHSLTSVRVPEGVTWIGDCAFDGCKKVTSITLPASVTGIEYGEDDSFRGCSQLRSFKVADGNRLFTSAGGMLATKDGELVVVPRGLRKGKSVTIPSGVRRIGDDTFAGFSALVSVTIPEGVEEIGWYAFENCSSLAEVKLPKSLKVIGMSAFSGCPLKSVSIPAGVTQVGRWAFSNLRNRDVKSIPGLVLVDGWLVSVSSSLWRDHDDPTEYLNDALQSSRIRGIAGGAFQNCGLLGYLVLPECVKYVPEDLCYGCTSLEWVEIPEGVTGIGMYAFYGCTNLGDMPIPRSVRHVGYSAFTGCGNLSGTDSGLGFVDDWIIQDGGISAFLAEDESFDGTLVISEDQQGVRGIADEAFDGAAMSCSLPDYQRGLPGVTRLVVGEGVVSIGEDAFCRCDDLEHVSVSRSVERIGEYAFAKCMNLQTAFLPDTLRGKVPWTAFPAGTRVSYYRNNGTVNNTRLIRFNANGGRVGDDVSSLELEDGSVLGALPSATRNGNMFVGWYTAPAGGASVDGGTVVSDNMTLYARWTAAWTVTLNVNGGKLDGGNKVLAAKGQAVGKLPTPTRDGYAFKGWYTKKSGGTKITAKTKVTKNVTWYAQWTVKKYAVKVVKEGKGTVTGAGSKAYKSKVTLKAKPASGYVFAGWWKVDGTDAQERVPPVSQKASLTVTVPLGGVTYKAKFITKAADKAGIGMSFGGVGVGAMDGGQGLAALPVVTNVCGVVIEPYPISASGLTPVSVSVTGLPTGLKYDTKKKAIAGVPTVAKAFTAKITVKSAGASRSWNARWVVTALPAFARGTFNGWTWGSGTPAASENGGGSDMSVASPKRAVTVSVTSAGKISAKAGALSFSRTGWTVHGDGTFTATMRTVRTVGTGKAKKTYTDVLALKLDPEKGWLEDQLAGQVGTFGGNVALADALAGLATGETPVVPVNGQDARSPSNADTAVSARRNPFGDNAEAKEVLPGIRELAPKSLVDDGGTTWKFAVSDKGVATISRTTGTGKNRKTVTATTIVEVARAGDGYSAKARFAVGGKVVEATW